MSLNPRSPRAKPRWLIVGLAVLALSALTVGIAAADYPNPPVNTIPAGYFTVTDSDGPNDVPAQSDVTQMGRDDAAEGVYKIFWSWDEIDQWTGTGQTGDACALFDSDGDTKINQAICARVSNTNADPTIVELVPRDSTHPVYFFRCSDAKNDRCTQPEGPLEYTAPTQIDAGRLGNLEKVNLITETDPFDPDGSDFPRDTTVEVHIAKALLDPNADLVNVCSYPSAGNGGNNNPFDCVVSPGGGFLQIVKDAQPDTTETFYFSVTKNGTELGARSITGDGSATPLAVLVTKSPVVITETNIPANWDLDDVSCTIEDDGATGTFDNANDRVTGVAIQSGKITTCTFVDKLTVGDLTLVKRVVNDNGGSADADFFGITSSAGTVSFGNGVADGANTLKYTSNTFTVPTGSYTFAELDKAGYTEGTWSCTGATVSGTAYDAGSVTVPGGGNVVCEITNDDDQGSLTLVKKIVNNSGGSAVVGAFGITTDAGTLSWGSAVEDPTDTFTYTSNKLAVDAGEYNFSENDVAGYTEGTWSCTGATVSGTAYDAGKVTVPNGGDVTCEITNDDLKADPDGTTVQSWILHDEITITGRRPNAPDENLNVIFTLFSDDTCTTAVEVEVEGVLVPYSETVSLTGEVAKTATGYTATESGTYYWIASYSGDQYNQPVATECGEEITQILAKDAYDGGRDDFVEPL